MSWRGRPTARAFPLPEAGARDRRRRRTGHPPRRRAGPPRRGLALRGGLVHRALAGDDDVGAGDALGEAQRLEHERRSRDERAAERREGGSEPARGARTGELFVRAEGLVGREAAIELLDVLGGRALLRAERPRRAARAQQRVADLAGDVHRHVDRADDLAQACAAAHGCAAAETDQQAPRPLAKDGEEQDAEAGARRLQRVALASASRPRPTASAQSTTAVRSGAAATGLGPDV